MNKFFSIFSIFQKIRRHFFLSCIISEAGIPKNAEFYKWTRYRYLRHYYLGGGFSISDRQQIAIHHYSIIAQSFRSDFLITSHTKGYTLWSKKTEEDHFAIFLRFPYAYNFDGDLCLMFRANGKDICIITLSVAPAQAVGISGESVFLISSIQGIAGEIDLIRKATEICNNITPANLLLMAAESVANVIGVKAIVGVGSGHMAGVSQTQNERSIFNYDAFWMPIVGMEEPRDFYHMPLPFVDKPIECIPAKHRSRARKRRELRTVIRDDIQAQANHSLSLNCMKENLVTPTHFHLRSEFNT